MEVVVKYGQSIFDLAILTNYGMDNIYVLINENTFMQSINFDFNANPGKILKFESNYTLPSPPQLTQKINIQPNPIQEVTVFDQQNIYDMLLQTYGTFDKTYDFIQDNNIANINQQSLTGQSVNFNTISIVDVGFRNTIFKNNIKISTGNISVKTQRFRTIQDGTIRIIDTNDQRIVA